MTAATKLFCKSCSAAVRGHTKTGYCASCFHANVDGVKTAYSASRWESGVAKKAHWAFRGAILSDVEIESFNQETNCGICNTPFTEAKKCLDHCHETGVYRGALCVQCNAALGKLGDDLTLVIERLQQYKARKVAF